MKLLRLLIAVFCLHASAPADVTKGNFGAARPEDSQRKVEANPEQKEKRTTYPFYGTLETVPREAAQTFQYIRGILIYSGSLI